MKVKIVSNSKPGWMAGHLAFGIYDDQKGKTSKQISHRWKIDEQRRNDDGHITSF